jgi:hypothetical protein
MRLIALVLALAVAPPAAAAGWSAPQTISSVSTFASRPFIAFNASGRGLAGFEQQFGLGNAGHNRLFLANRDASGRYGRARRLGPDELFLGGLSLDKRGRSTVLAVFSKGGQRDRMEVYSGAGAGGFGRPQVLHTSPYTFMRTPKLAADAAGDAAAIWRELPRRSGSSDVAMLATRTAGHAFGRARRVSSAAVSDVEVGMGGNGDFVVTWLRRGLVEARIGHGSKLGPVLRLANNHLERGVSLAVAMDARGDALVAWTSHARTLIPSAKEQANLAYRPAGRGFMPFKQITSWAIQPVLTTGGVGAAFYASGKAAVAWNGRDASGDGVFATTAAAGAPGTVSRLSPPSQPVVGEHDQLQAVAGGRGLATVGWTHFGPEGRATNSQGFLFASDLNASGGFATQPVTGSANDALDATLGYNPRDRSLSALWEAKESAAAFVTPREFIDASVRR